MSLNDDAWAVVGPSGGGCCIDFKTDKIFVSVALQLTSYGLTLNEAKVYLFLLVSRDSSVKTISDSLKLHRVEVYRKLRELEELGLVELQLGVPKRYAAVAAEDALTVLLSRREKELSESKKKSAEMIATVNLLSKTHGGGARDPVDQPQSTYKLIVGRERYFKEMRTLMAGSKQEILRIVFPEAINRTYNNGFDQEYIHARARGVSIRIISEINSKNRVAARRLAKTVNLRHLDAVRARFTVIDGMTCVFAGVYDEKSQTSNSAGDSYLVLTDIRFGEAFRFFFENMWQLAGRTELDSPRTERRTRKIS